MLMKIMKEKVSVPIRGLLNLTWLSYLEHELYICYQVSVPIRGLLNLTLSLKQ